MIRQLVAHTLTVLIHILCFAIMSVRKYSVKKTVLIYSLFFAIFLCLTMLASRVLFDIRSFYAISSAYIGTILVSFFIFMMTSADPAWKKVFLFLSYASIFCIIFCSSNMISSIWFKDQFGVAAVYTKTILRTLLYLPAIWVYIAFLRPAMREVPGSNKRIWHAICLVSLLFLILFSMFCFIYYVKNDFRAWHSVLFAVTVLIYGSVLWMMIGTIRYMIKESRTELIEENMKYLHEQLEIAKQNELSAKTIRHDFRHHNQNLAAMLKKGDVQEALRYIEQYNESLEAAKPREFCPHVTVNAILNSFYAKAQSEGILVFFSADTQNTSAVADMDYVAILSNLLENAFNGCKECHSRGEIAMNIRTVAGKTVIVCSNPCKPDIAIENNMIRQRGIGIDSIVTAAGKYDGDIRYRMEGGILTVCVILKNA